MTPATVEMLRRHSCEHKVRRSAKGARLNAERRRAAGENVYPYRCIFCEHWHVGHTPSWRTVKKIAGVIRFLAYPPADDQQEAAG